MAARRSRAYWVHNGFVDMGAEKMSKSLGNVVTPAELLEQGHRGETLRLALLSAHYRQPLPWTEALIAQTKAMLDRLYRAAGDVGGWRDRRRVVEALSDDLNTPVALARLQAIEDPAVVRASAALLGLLSSSADEWFRGGADQAAIEARIAERARCQEGARLRRRRPDPRRAQGGRHRLGGRAGRHYLAPGMNASALHDRNPAPRGVAAATGRARSAKTGVRSSSRRPAEAGSRSRSQLDEERRVRRRLAEGSGLRVRAGVRGARRAARDRACARRGRRCARDDQPLARQAAATRPATGPGSSVLAPARPRKGRHGAILLPFRALLAAIEAAK